MPSLDRDLVSAAGKCRLCAEALPGFFFHATLSQSRTRKTGITIGFAP
jgi:hypothetical protein